MSSSSIAQDGFCDLETVETAQGAKILHSSYIEFPANSLTAILGPSGAGKTSLLQVITDSIPSNIIARANLHLPGESAVVPQDDRLHGFYTVRSYLHHYARLAGMPQEGLDDKIDTLLQKLGLKDQANTIVGDLFFKGLSGGQQRRLSVALEALSEPINLFLDEPTSGLDAESALQVMKFLKSYAREGKGRRVILTIHQPSSFIWNIIDHVVLLAKGKLMYNGPREEMETFFEKQGQPTPAGWNVADHYVMAVNDEFRENEISVDDWAERFRQWSGDHGKEVTELKQRSSVFFAAKSGNIIETHRTSSPTVVFELIKRYFLNLAFNPGILGTRIAMYGMLALMVGALFWDLGERTDFESVQSRIAVAFYCVAFFIFMSVAVMPFTVIERAIVDKEVLNRYYNPIYYQVSQAICSIPGCAILAFLVTLLIITMTKMNAPLWYFLDMFLSLFVAEALAQCVSHVVPHFIIGIALVAGMYGFFMLFQGFMLVPSDFPDWLSWVYYCAFHTYAWRTFMVSEFREEPVFTGGSFKSGEDVLVFYEIEDVDRTNDMIVLVGYGLFIHCLSFVLLYLRYNMFDGKILPKTDDSIHGGKQQDQVDGTEPPKDVADDKISNHREDGVGEEKPAQV